MKNKQQGMVLILVVSILALLSLMSVTFVRMMVYEQVAASNSGANSNARLIAQCGIEEAKARLWKYLLTARENNSLLVSTESSLFSNQNTNYTNFWYPIPSDNHKEYYDLKTAVRNKQPISLHANAGSNEFSASGYIGIVRQRRSQYLGTYEVNGNFYALQIEDNQGKLNINSHRPKKIATDDSNAYDTKCQYSNLVMNNLLRRLAVNCGLGANKNDTLPAIIANVLRPINASEPPLYTNLSNVREKVLNEITRHHIPMNNSLQGNLNKFFYNICINSWMDKKTQVPISSYIKRTTADKLHNIKYYIEYRSPININTVSLELLAAIIEEVGANVFTCYCKGKVAQDTIFDNQQAETEIKYVIEQNTIQFYDPTNQDVSDNNAMAIARALIGNIDLDSQNRRRYYNFHELDSAIDAITGDYWRITEQDETRKLALQRLPKDVLKANFNPNARENTVNLNANNYINATKGDLYLQEIYEVIVKGQPTLIDAPTHTTELCFWCNGYASITAIGMITANNHQKIIEESVINEQVAFGDWVSHTTQHDFFSNNVINTDEAEINNPNATQTNCTIDNTYVFPDETAEKELSTMTDSVPSTYSASKYSGCIEITPNPFDNDLPYKNTISGFESSHLFMAMKRKITIPNDSIADAILYTDYKTLLLKNSSEYNSSNALTAASNYNRANSSSSATELNYKRKIKFWLKFNGNILLTPYKSGIYAETRFSGPRSYIPYNWDKNPGTTTANAPKLPFNEGSQLYIYKNINDQLRISTTYFCRYYILHDTGGEYQGIAIQAGEGNGYYGLALGVNQDFTTDPNWKYARLDGSIDLKEIASQRSWQQNSWHHFNIETDSHQGTITCYIDGINVSTDANDNLELRAQYENNELHPSFCIANDTFTGTTSKKSINGFQRRQRDNDISNGSLIIFREATADTTTSFLSNGVMVGYNSEYTNNTRYNNGSFTKTISTTVDNIEWVDENTQYHPDWAVVGMLSWIGYSKDPNNHITFTSTQHNSTRVSENSHTYDMLAPNSDQQTNLSTTYTIDLTPDDNESPVVDSVSLQVLFPQVISSEIIK